MRKLVYFTIFLAFVAMIVLVSAVDEYRVEKVYVIGRGIAINPTEVTDFKLIKIAVANFSVTNVSVIRGLLALDTVKYPIKGLTSNETFFQGNLFSNDSQIGNISLTKIEKPETEVWAGTITIYDKVYFAYIIGVEKTFKPDESGEKIGEYCKERPTDERCKGVAFVCLPSEDLGQCKEKIIRYCTANPTDSRCKNVERIYCRENLDDVRCRYELKQFCTNNPAADVCSDLTRHVERPLECLDRCRLAAQSECGSLTGDAQLACYFKVKTHCINECSPSTILPENVTTTTVCPDELKPVCATNGITYANDCIAKVRGATIAYSGICTNNKTITEEPSVATVNTTETRNLSTTTQVSLDVAKAAACEYLVNYGCYNISVSNVPVYNFDANKDSKVNAEGDNLSKLCGFYYGITNEDNCRLVCGCPSRPSSSGTSSGYP